MVRKEYITATEEARVFLSEADPILGAIIEKFGALEYELETKYFESLVFTIVGQQLSGKAADAIWVRFEKLFGGEITPKKVFGADDEAIRDIGVSYNKIRYMKNLAKAALDN
ncbi:MAG: hypothetical protein LBQ27_06210, partial [Clostridiales bacterium]|nr:hypothetical protein [Clostridiales bacterium]